eukprot:366084-Chlamydomonas_euryale.AAC.3
MCASEAACIQESRVECEARGEYVKRALGVRQCGPVQCKNSSTAAAAAALQQQQQHCSSSSSSTAAAAAAALQQQQQQQQEKRERQNERLHGWNCCTEGERDQKEVMPRIRACQETMAA